MHSTPRHAEDPGPVALTPEPLPIWDADPQWAWAEFQPDAGRPWNLALAGHLYRRSGFGANWQQLQQAVAAGPRATVEQLLHPPADVQAAEAAWDQEEEASARTTGIESARAWWLRRMIQTRCPLREKMTLFWHSHLGVSHVRVASPPLMMRHVQTLRRHALGSYRTLLDEMVQDPAVLLACGADANRRADPNDRFARQLLERLSLGPGHFDEQDVREVARAFTGWFVLQGRLKYLAREFDSGPKRVLGQEGPWKTDDVVRIVLAQSAAPRLVARKLFRWLVSETEAPSDALIAPLAETLGEQLDVGQAVAQVLRSNLFFSQRAQRRRVKSPVEYALGIIRAFGGLVPTAPLGGLLAELGQDLYAPPTLRGWVGGRHWINAATMLGRANLADALLAARGPLGGKLDPQAVVQEQGAGTPREQARFLVRLLLEDDDAPSRHSALLASVPEAAGAATRDALRQLAYQVVTLPEYHLG